MIKKYLSWVYTFSKATAKERGRIREILLEGIKNFKGRKKGTDIYSYLRGVEVELVGFVPNIEYFKEKGASDEMEALFTHTFGGPTLLYKHKDYPILILASPTLRFNDSYLRDAKKNVMKNEILGITD